MATLYHSLSLERASKLLLDLAWKVSVLGEGSCVGENERLKLKFEGTGFYGVFLAFQNLLKMLN